MCALQVARTRLQGAGDDSVRQLSNLLAVYNQVVALRHLSVALRRRCAFLESVQSILRTQNTMLVNLVLEGSAGGRTMADDQRQRVAGVVASSPSWKRKRTTSEKLPAASLKRTVLGGERNGHRPLQYQGSGGAMTCGTTAVTSPAPGKLQHRSMSADSIVDLDVSAAVSACVEDGAAQQDRKRSGKLQETWQQVNTDEQLSEKINYTTAKF